MVHSSVYYRSTERPALQILLLLDIFWNSVNLQVLCRNLTRADCSADPQGNYVKLEFVDILERYSLICLGLRGFKIEKQTF